MMRTRTRIICGRDLLAYVVVGWSKLYDGGMLDKQKEIEGASADILTELQTIVSLTPNELTAAMRRFMDPQELKMFDLGVYCENEMIKAQNAGAHLAACLMGASMNETLLALMCLRYESEVVLTKQFGYSTKRKNDSRRYREVVADWRLEQLITVAEEKEWIPASIVNDEIKFALSQGFRELAPIAHPEMSEEAVDRGAQTFFAYPGTAMLRMTQDLRNAIHAGRWLRSERAFIAENFSGWCHFATHLCGEIRMCLLYLLMKRTNEIALGKLSKLAEMMNELPPSFRSVLEEQLKEKLQR